MNNKLYSDKLIEISEDSIIIRNYYFPFGSRQIYWNEVENIVVYKPGLLTGKYRYWGTGDFHTWFPPDNRLKRDKIFIMKLKNKWWQIGFTVENSQTVIDLLKKKCSLTDNNN